MEGESGVFGFPFRLHGAAELPSLSGLSPDQRFTYRGYRPFSVRSKGSPISPSPPFESWPEFAWSSAAGVGQRLRPPNDFSITFFGGTTYDALRVDVLGPGAADELEPFVRRFLAWLRHLSGQVWIGNYEFHTDSLMKHHFPIDEAGAALDTPIMVTSFTTPDTAARAVDSPVLAEAFQLATQGLEPPRYWLVFYDGQNDCARRDVATATLNYALSLEIARNIRFPSFCPTASRAGVGQVLKPPFDGIDLLKHLSSALEARIGRNLETEKPSTWLHMKNLYVARHHVAHGRPPVVRQRGTLSPVTVSTIGEWTPAVRDTIAWIEGLGSKIAA